MVASDISSTAYTRIHPAVWTVAGSAERPDRCPSACGGRRTPAHLMPLVLWAADGERSPGVALSRPSRLAARDRAARRRSLTADGAYGHRQTSAGSSVAARPDLSVQTAAGATSGGACGEERPCVSTSWFQRRRRGRPVIAFSSSRRFFASSANSLSANSASRRSRYGIACAFPFFLSGVPSALSSDSARWK